MNKLPFPERVQILTLLCEGNSLRATSRIADVSINTVTKLLVDAGKVCADYQDRTLRHLTCKRVQVDEIWSFVGAKEGNIPQAEKQFGRGDIWTWIAIDADSKLVVSWLVGRRNISYGTAFLRDVADRIDTRIQLTSDGHLAYNSAVNSAFGNNVDYAQLQKIYGVDLKAEHRYSPPVCIGAKPTPIRGNPNPAHISTSYVERQNLTIRMGNRRFTRLTNAFSKKLDNHVHSLALHFMYYNFVRVHQTTRITPAQAARVTDTLWSMEDLVNLLEARNIGINPLLA
jgi:IS1 family transposase